MARITVTNVLEATKQTQVYDIVNAIRNSSSSYFQEFVPLANATNVAEVGAGIVLNQQTQNEFISALVNRIGLVILRNVVLKNPLSQFKQGTLEMGLNIEEIFTDLTTEHMYDADKSEYNVFAREIPDVKALYHELNRKGFYKQTIQEDMLKQAFISWDKFASFTASIVQAMYNTSEVDEYKYMKLLLDNYYAKGHFKVVEVVKAIDNADEFVKALRRNALMMSMPQGSRNFNSLNVHTTTPMEDLLVIMTADTATTIDVDVLAKAFNMDKASFLGRQIILDTLGENPDTGEKIEAILVDRKFFMVFDNTLKMTSIYNPEGLYWNYFLHVWQVISASRFANAIAFVSNPTKVLQEVVVSPAIKELRPGPEYTLDAVVSYTKTLSQYYGGPKPDYTLTYQVLNAETLQPTTTGITLTPNNNDTVTIKVLPTAAKKLILVATAAIMDDDDVVESVSGRAYLTVK